MDENMIAPFSADFLRSILNYDRETGAFTWKSRSDRDREWNTRYAGKVAGCKSSHMGKLYWAIRVNDRLYQAHRLAWLYEYGEWPDRTVDHEDRDGLHNWISNLRLATRGQQMFNQGLRRDSQSGIKGIQIRCGNYRATVALDGKRTTRTFSTLAAAEMWRRETAQGLHGEFAHSTSVSADHSDETGPPHPVEAPDHGRCSAE